MSHVAPLSRHPSHGDTSLADIIRTAGISGAGGAGFPTYPKYDAPLNVHVTNAQESEPGYRCDKWLHEAHPDTFAALYAFLLEWGVEKVLFGAKLKDRSCFQALEDATGGTVLDCTGRNRHPLDEQENPILFAYTDDRYAYGKEGALLLVAANTKVPAGERPNQHGFIVNNSETLWNIICAVKDAAPVTEKLVHVYGESPRHAFVRVPVGTPVATILEDAGMPLAEVEAKGFALVDGGPGWFEKIDSPRDAVVTRRTNSVLILDPAYRDPNGKDVLAKGPNPGYPKEGGPTVPDAPADLASDVVRIPLIDNPAFDSVKPAVPTVKVGDEVARQDVIAAAADTGISIPAHASISGKVTAVTPTSIEITAG